MTSIVALVRDEPVLRQRSLRQALVFAAFSAYWTSIAYELSGRHGFNQAEIGLFALVGAVGVTAAPIVGRLADHGADRYATGAALLLVPVALIIADVGAGSVVLLGLAAVLLDVGMTSNQILSQRQIYRLRPDARARLNTVYMGSAFLGGAAGWRSRARCRARTGGPAPPSSAFRSRPWPSCSGPGDGTRPRPSPLSSGMFVTRSRCRSSWPRPGFVKHAPSREHHASD
jgi:hypothetical protein